MLNKKQTSMIFEALGEASMCWDPKPEGEFDSSLAEKVGKKLIKKLNKTRKRKPIYKSSISGLIVSKQFAKDNPTVTYKDSK